MNTDGLLPAFSPALATVEKFYELNDDLTVVRTLTRRVFFEFLRANPSMTTEEIDTLWSVADLISELCEEKNRIVN